MAIGNSGNSAASRFRPRGTAPIAGLGRRNLLAEDADTGEAEETQAEAVEESAASNTLTQQTQEFVERGARAQHAVNQAVLRAQAAHAAQTQSDTVSATTAEGGVHSSTSTAPSPSSASASSPRRRGRPPASTKSTDTLGSAEDTGGGLAFSAPAARARMREIEAMAKAMKTNYENDLRALQQEYRSRTTALQLEYQGLSQQLLDHTFGF